MVFVLFQGWCQSAAYFGGKVSGGIVCEKKKRVAVRVSTAFVGIMDSWTFKSLNRLWA